MCLGFHFIRREFWCVSIVHCFQISFYLRFYCLSMIFHIFSLFSTMFFYCNLEAHIFIWWIILIVCRMCLVRCIIWIILSCCWYLLCSSWFFFFFWYLMMSSLAYSYINNRYNYCRTKWLFHGTSFLRYETDIIISWPLISTSSFLSTNI